MTTTPERHTSTMEERTVRRGRRIGRWQYVVDRWNGDRWRLDGTTIDLEYDPIHGGCSIRGAWVVWAGPRSEYEPIDHFLTGYCGAMWWVESFIDGSHATDPDPPRWALHARAELALAGAA
jgi:hypothetical protein